MEYSVTITFQTADDHVLTTQELATLAGCLELAVVEPSDGQGDDAEWNGVYGAKVEIEEASNFATHVVE